MTWKDKITNLFRRKPEGEVLALRNGVEKPKPPAYNQIVVELNRTPLRSEADWTEQAEDPQYSPHFADEEIGEEERQELDGQNAPSNFFDAEFLRVFAQPEIECLDDFCFFMAKFPHLNDFFERIKKRVMAGQYLFEAPSPESEPQRLPVLTVRIRLRADQKSYELSSLKLALGGQSLEDSSLYASEIDQKKAIINIFSNFVSYATGDFPVQSLNLYDKLVFFKYIGYIISLYSQKDLDKTAFLRKLN
ncbi:MAG: hypothetical protein LBJ64_02280 [Deltaproteobacteria bacterium]|jgi:hypothetical protein|nr:hypothetical protein [Deltaproteobacteria bacterium]